MFGETIIQLKFAKAFFALVKDPKQTDAVFDLADAGAATGAPIQHALKMAKLSPEFNQLLNERYTPEHVELSVLLALPEHTFGNAYARHMRENRLDPNFYRKPKGNSDVDYLKTRARQTHDFWHIATEYGTDEWGEFALQSFMLAQFQPAISLVILAASLLRVAKTSPERTGEFIELIFSAYNRGKKASKLLGVKWEEEFETPLTDLKERLNLRN